jgi:hypothetical protein
MTRIVDFADGFTSALAPSTISIWEILTLQLIPASGEITLGSGAHQIILVEGDGGPQEASLTPFGASATPENGATIRVKGNDNTNTLQLTHNDAAYGCILNGDAILGKDDLVELVYFSAVNRYIEQSRNF